MIPESKWRQRWFFFLYAAYNLSDRITTCILKVWVFNNSVSLPNHYWHFGPDNFFVVGVYPVHCRMFGSNPGHYALDISSMSPPLTTNNVHRGCLFTFPDRIGPSWEPLLDIIPSNLHYSHYIPCRVDSLAGCRRKPWGAGGADPLIRNIANHQQKASGLYSRQKGRPSISWLNRLSMIAWLASFLPGHLGSTSHSH